MTEFPNQPFGKTKTLVHQYNSQLIIKTNTQDLTKKYLHLFYRTTAQALKEIVCPYPLAPPIKLISSVISEQNILALHARGDCYISLCHGEGWGIGDYDAAKFAKHVIITGYGGQCDYLPADRAFLFFQLPSNQYCCSPIGTINKRF